MQPHLCTHYTSETGLGLRGGGWAEIKIDTWYISASVAHESWHVQFNHLLCMCCWCSSSIQKQRVFLSLFLSFEHLKLKKVFQGTSVMEFSIIPLVGTSIIVDNTFHITDGIWIWTLFDSLFYLIGPHFLFDINLSLFCFSIFQSMNSAYFRI